jgi:predicted alpha/beta hydrolase family esterase
VWWAALHWTEAFREKMRGALLVAPPDVDALDVNARLRDFRPLPNRRLPFTTILVASRNDALMPFDRSREIARLWGSELVDAGPVGHINAESGIDEWPAGLRHLAGLSGHVPNLLVSELGLRTALA